MKWMTNISTREEVEARAWRRNCITLRWNAYSHSFWPASSPWYIKSLIISFIGEEHPLNQAKLLCIAASSQNSLLKSWPPLVRSYDAALFMNLFDFIAMVHCSYNGSLAVWFGQTIHDVAGQSSLIVRLYHSLYQPADQWDGITGVRTHLSYYFHTEFIILSIHVIILTFIIPLLIPLSQSLLRHHSSRRFHKSMRTEVIITTKSLIPYHPMKKYVDTSWHSSPQHPSSARSCSCLLILVPSPTSL